MVRLPIQISEECLRALRIFAKQEYRDARQQAAWIIEHELIRLGLMPINQVELASDQVQHRGPNAAE